jgi:ribonuclease HI
LTQNVWVAYFDGCAMPNPGRMSLGAVITAPDGTRRTLSETIYSIGCNNEAELRALIATLQDLKSAGATSVLLHSDNSVLVEQVGPTAVKPIVRLAFLFDEARDLLASFDYARVEWIPRHRNIEADLLARAAFGLPEKQSQKAKRTRRQGLG